MPVVFVPGKGNIEFPDNMTPYEIDLAIRRQIIPGRKPDTISAPKGPEATLSSFFGGILEEAKAVPSATKNLIEKTIGTPGKAIESLVTLGGLGTLPQTLTSSAQRSFLSAIGAAPPPPPPPPPKPPTPRLSERIDEAIGLTSPERRAEEARRSAIYGPLATRSRSEMETATARTRADLARPEFESVLGEGLYSGASSLVQMAPGLIGSVLTRTPAPALANIAAITAGPTYQKYEERGATPEEALLGTVAETGIELGTEAIPLGALVSRLGKVGFGRFLKEYLGRELPSELVATITQNAVDTAVANPDKTWSEYVQELPNDLATTAVATLVPGTVLATASKGAQLASRLAGKPQEEEAAAPRAPRTPPRAPPPPADMEALSRSLGPVGGKITLQEPSGPQEYTFEGFDEDGGVVLSDADGVTFSEDPDQIQAAIKTGVADSEEGMGGMAFGMDITEGLDEAEAEGLDEAEAEAKAPVTGAAVPQGVSQWDVQNRNNRSDALFEGDITSRQAREQAVAEYGNRSTHGMAKARTATQAYNDLVNLLQNGIDRTRGRGGSEGRGGLDTAGLSAETGSGSGVGTASGAAYFDGPFALVGREGHSGIFTSTDQIAGILVNDALSNTGVVEDLRQQFPNLAVETYSNAANLLAQTRAPATKEKFTIEPSPAAAPSVSTSQMTADDAAAIAYEQEFIDQIDGDLEYIFEQRAENAYEGEDPETKEEYERQISELQAEREKAANNIDVIKARYAAPQDRPKFTIEPVVKEEAAPAPPRSRSALTEAIANSEAAAGTNLPLDEGIPAQLKAMERDNTPSYMANLEREARQIAADQGAASVSSLHFAEALNNAADRMNARQPRPKFTLEPMPGREEPAPAPAPAPPAAVGKTDRATIPATREKVDVQYELQDLSNIRFAENELQNRDRSRPQTQQFLRRFTSEFDPEGLGEDRSTDRGAPIINKDNTILSGNGRTLGLEEIYENYPEQAEAYRQFLREQGYDIEGIERPVLVRRLKSDVDERKFVVASNEPDVAALSPPEQAAQDARDILTPAVLSKYNGGDLKAARNDAFVSAFLAEMSPQQRENAMDDKGNVSAQTLKRIENALLYKAYGESGRASDIFISKAMERSDDDTKTLTNALVDVANDWIKFQQDIENGEIDKKYDITKKLMETVGTVSDIKASGNSVSGAVRSPDMVEPMDPFVRDILLAFHDDKTFRILSKKAIAEKLRAYTEVAANQQAAPDMFGKAETPSARDIWKRVDAGEGVQQAQLFEPGVEGNKPVTTNFWQTLFDEAEKIPSLSREIDNLIKLRKEGKIEDVDFVREVEDIQWFVKQMRDAKRWRDMGEPRLRGADRIREVILAAKRRGQMTEEAADFAEWFALRNPHLIDDLGVSVTKEGPRGFSAFYTPLDRIMHLVKGSPSEVSAVHEIMHHLERMMPEPIRKAIKRSWAKELDKVEALNYPGRNYNDEVFFKALRAFHEGKSVNLKGEKYTPREAFDFAAGLINSGKVDGRLYQYMNPSEFWAVNATEILQGRHEVQGSLLGRLRNWLRELSTKIKGLFNLDSNAPIIKALDSLAKGDGKFVSDQMLEEKLGKFGEIDEAPIKEKAPKKVTNNQQAMGALLNGTPDQMRNAVAKAQKPNDKIIDEGANLQKENRGCD